MAAPSDGSFHHIFLLLLSLLLSFSPTCPFQPNYTTLPFPPRDLNQTPPPPPPPPPFLEFSDQHESVLVQPPVLVFKDSPVCIPAVSLIDVINRSPTKELHVTGIVSENYQFHPAMFKPQVLEPYGRTSIQVIFLPRTVGAVETTLKISTSEGDISYRIYAQPVVNPYQIHPIIGAKVPAGVSYVRPLIMHNPYNEVLTIREIFTTESFLNIIIPEPDELVIIKNMEASPKPGSESAWHLQPKSEKQIVQLGFRATKPGLYQGYVHVKTDHDKMVVPVDFTVLKGGLHLNPKEIDFGIITLQEERRVIHISLLNSGSTDLELIEAVPTLPDALLSIELNKGLVIPAGNEVANAFSVSYSGRASGRVSGKIVVITNHTNSGLATVELPYKAQVLHGGVLFQRKDVTFAVPSILAMQNSSTSGDFQVIRNVPFSNWFPIPLLLQSAHMKECSNSLQVFKYAKGSIADRQQCWPDISIVFKPQVAMESYALPTICTLALTTNGSTHSIPICLYDGRLIPVNDLDAPHIGPASKNALISRRFFGQQSQRLFLNFGTMIKNQTRTRTFYLLNYNPVEIPIRALQSSNGQYSLEYKGQVLSSFAPKQIVRIYEEMVAQRYNGSASSDNSESKSGEKLDGSGGPNSNYSSQRFLRDSKEAEMVDAWERAKGNNWLLDPGHAAVMKLTIRSPAEVHGKEGKGFKAFDVRLRGIVLQTPLDQINITVGLKVVDGQLSWEGIQENKINVNPSYPLSQVYTDIILSSTMGVKAEVLEINAGSPLFTSDLVQAEIAPHSKSVNVGNIRLNPTLLTSDPWLSLRNLMNASSVSGGAYEALVRMTDAAVGEKEGDLDVWQRLWQDIKNQGLNTFKTSVSVHTDIMDLRDLEASVTLDLPKLTGTEPLLFPLTHVGHVIGRYLVVENPSPVSIEAKLVQASDDSFIQEDRGQDWWDVKLQVLDRGHGAWAHYWGDEEGLVYVDPSTNELHQSSDERPEGASSFRLENQGDPVVIAPYSQSLLGPILFRPTRIGEFDLKVWLVNNFSRAEPVLIKGEGGEGRLGMEMEGGEAVKALLFDVTESTEMEKTDKGIHTYLGPDVKSVRIKNRGNLPVQVVGMKIEGETCGRRKGVFSVEGCFEKNTGESSSFRQTQWIPAEDHMDVNVSFTTNCLSSQVAGALLVETSVGVQRIMLEAHVSRLILSECEKERLRAFTTLPWIVLRGCLILFGIFSILRHVKNACTGEASIHRRRKKGLRTTKDKKSKTTGKEELKEELEEQLRPAEEKVSDVDGEKNKIRVESPEVKPWDLEIASVGSASGNSEGWGIDGPPTDSSSEGKGSSSFLRQESPLASPSGSSSATQENFSEVTLPLKQAQGEADGRVLQEHNWQDFKQFIHRRGGKKNASGSSSSLTINDQNSKAKGVSPLAAGRPTQNARTGKKELQNNRATIGGGGERNVTTPNVKPQGGRTPHLMHGGSTRATGTNECVEAGMGVGGRARTNTYEMGTTAIRAKGELRVSPAPWVGTSKDRIRSSSAGTSASVTGSGAVTDSQKVEKPLADEGGSMILGGYGWKARNEADDWGVEKPVSAPAPVTPRSIGNMATFDLNDASHETARAMIAAVVDVDDGEDLGSFRATTPKSATKNPWDDAQSQATYSSPATSSLFSTPFFSSSLDLVFPPPNPAQRPFVTHVSSSFATPSTSFTAYTMASPPGPPPGLEPPSNPDMFSGLTSFFTEEQKRKSSDE